jgi:phosphopantetheinyl transferase (holo-ACP synthase)
VSRQAGAPFDPVAARAWQIDATALLGDVARGFGALDWGVVFAAATSWNHGERRIVPLNGDALLQMTHDEREAPVPQLDDGDEDRRLLVSLSDEEGTAVCAWVRVPPDSRLVGLGVDLASRADFSGERGRRFNPLLFTPREHELVASSWSDDDALGYAFAFSAKEAAFKSCAAPLRRWYQGHDERLGFDVRCFELLDWSHEAGTARHGEAQRAMDAMGIDRIELQRMSCADMALTLALALTR